MVQKKINVVNLEEPKKEETVDETQVDFDDFSKIQNEVKKENPEIEVEKTMIL